MKTIKNTLVIFVIFASLLYLFTGCEDENARPLKKIKVSNIYSEEDQNSVVKNSSKAVSPKKKLTNLWTW